MKRRVFTDQMQRTISLAYPPRRIISLVPSQTELLFDLGVDEDVVGITKFCIHPRVKFKSTTKVGGTKKLDVETIRDLKPDLIIGNKEENDQGQIEGLMKEFPVWMSDIKDLNGAIEMIKGVGEVTGRQAKANLLAASIVESFENMGLERWQGKRVAYFIWKDPYMLAGKNTFIDDILLRAGLENISVLNRYPQVTNLEIQELNPDVIMLSSEPYPFKNVHVGEMKEICRQAKVLIVDGEMFSWYGSRLLQTPSYLRSLLRA